MRKVMKAAAAATILLAGGVVRAEAADMSLPPAYQLDPEPMVEFGSGWYLRGDLSYSSMSTPVSNPPAYQIVGGAPSPYLPLPGPGASIFGNQSISTGLFAASIGGGYQFNRWFRMDATYDWRQMQAGKTASGILPCALDVTNPVTKITTLTNTGACYKSDGVSTQSWTALVNAYADLGTWWNITPYVGAGVGMTHIHAQAAEDWFWSTGAPYGIGKNTYNSVTGVSVHYGYPGNIGPVQVRNNFSFALMTGIAYDIAPHLKLDVGYRYLNMGALTVVDIAGNTVRKTLDAQEVRAGLRWTPDL